jgi:hypothetical protein
LRLSFAPVNWRTIFSQVFLPIDHIVFDSKESILFFISDMRLTLKTSSFVVRRQIYKKGCIRNTLS